MSMRKRTALLLAFMLPILVLTVFSAQYINPVKGGSAQYELDGSIAPKIQIVNNQNQNITMHIGDLILSDNDALIIRDGQLDLKGNLKMSGNSTLILDNGVLYPDFEKGQYSYTLHDNAKIIMQRDSNIESLIFDFILYDNASIDISDSTLSQNIRLDSINATLQVANSYIRVATLYGNSLFINSTLSDINFYGNARIVDSHIEQFEVSSLYHSIYVDLVNSTYDRVNTDFIGQGVIRINWPLTILVESQGAPLQNADVQVYSQANNSLVAKLTTANDGKALFELPALEISESGQTNLGDYTIKVTQNERLAQESITLNSSTQKTISIDNSPFITFAVAIAIGLVLTVITVTLILKRKHKR